MFGTQDLVIALVLGAFFFGAKRLPEIARSLGKSMQEFKKGVAGEPAENESPASPSPPPAVATIAPHTCRSCQSQLEPEWKHCPRCGASTESGPTPGSHPPR
jgi:TatA/E family protein of Tat protein translocase